MKHIELESQRGTTLRGVMHENDSETAVMLVHGFTGYRGEYGRFDELASRLSKDHNVLAVDMAGSGESDDEPLNTDAWGDDVETGVAYLKEQGFDRIGAIGFSIGGLLLVRYAHHFDQIAMWAPITAAAGEAMPQYYRDKAPQFAEQGHIDRKVTEQLGRTRMRIAAQFIEDWETLDQKELIDAARFNTPVLIVHGDADTIAHIEHSRTAIDMLPEGSELIEVPGSNHLLEPDWEPYIAPVVDWMNEKLN